ncbi:PepSY1/2 domain-containing protein [Alicyclobacillus sp. ALC3]|uniref:PepSY1/2 domain-containing protein n=1 Tax=Alicyclobacillus sp. ALC3 TaxID=2796143 RepID=UPI002378CDD3|nr:PepSY1/2 domain-containing protein [Alicyclobacillus sp. ALC3]WDL97123.1 germination protein YpeB [Alicyclobacillus sp. ALC3]
MRIHRTTWIALPVLALVVAGTGTGWWGYQQYLGRQALAVQVTNSYNAAFHGLTSNLEQIHQQLGEVMVSADPAIITTHMQDVARLSFAANTDAARLPAPAFPDGQIQAFTMDLGKQAEQDAVHPTPSASLRKQVLSAWTETGKMLTVLHQVDLTNHGSTVQPTGLWKGKTQAAALPSFVASLQQLDAAGSTPTPNKTTHTTSVPMSKAKVGRSFTQFVGLQAVQGWQIHRLPRSTEAAYSVNGKTQEGTVYGSVSNNLQVLSFHSERAIAQGSAKVSVADARDHAQAWLKSRGLTPASLTDTATFDHTAYFTFSPELSGLPVLDQPMVVQVALDRGDVIGYSGGAFEKNRFQALPSRQYSVSQLQHRLSSQFVVAESRQVIALDSSERPQPAVAFYGTSQRETYCVVVNAHTGKEMRITQLTNHT